MKTGIIRDFNFFYDVSHGIDVLSCKVTIEYKGLFGRKKFFSGCCFNYLGERLNKGDEVYFEDGFVGLKALFKK
jgi:hypothetical protein